MSYTRRCEREKVLDMGERGITTKASIAFYSHPLVLHSIFFAWSRKSFEKASNAEPLSKPANPMIPRKKFGVPVYDYSFGRCSDSRLVGGETQQLHRRNGTQVSIHVLCVNLLLPGKSTMICRAIKKQQCDV